MKLEVRCLLVAIAVFVLAGEAWAQQNDICSERGIIPQFATPTRRFNVIFGRVSIRRSKENAPTSVVVWLREGGSTKRFALDRSGTYCFEKSTGGEITLEVNGQQVDRRAILTTQPEQREDFEISLTSSEASAPPGVVSAKFNYERNGENANLYERALSALAEKKPKKAIEHLTAIVNDDQADYLAHATLGSIYYDQKRYSESEKWFKRSVEINPAYTPAWISLSQSQYALKKYDAAIESCEKLIALEPTSALGFYVLGEAYLRTRKGNLAVNALNHAIKLDPVGMAECHLILAELYDLNGGKKLASREYKAFVAKVPNHPDRNRFERYIKENPE